MLKTFPRPSGGDDAAAGKTVWFDLDSPTEAEIAEVEQCTGVALPRRGALSEIERSSRLQRRNGVLTMSTPTTVRHAPDSVVLAPLGFVLSHDWLITIRFAPLPAFEAVIERFGGQGGSETVGSAVDVFVRLGEEIVDRIADGLEHLAEDLGKLSVATFHADDANAAQAVRSTPVLRGQLRHLGRLGDRLSEIRDGLLGLGRVLAFTEEFGCSAAQAEVKSRLGAIRQDLASLSDYNEHLTGKVQFVLDALVGLIGIAQNDIFKVLTIVSIVGIPPTLLAGIYGMNFKGMPEYDWTYGYPYGLAVIALSGILPLVWFKLKGWF